MAASSESTARVRISFSRPENLIASMMRCTRRRETPGMHAGMLSGKLPVAVWGLKVTNGGRDAIKRLKKSATSTSCTRNRGLES